MRDEGFRVAGPSACSCWSDAHAGSRVSTLRRPEHEPTVLAPVHVLIVYTRSELGVVTRVLVSRRCFQIG